MPARVHRITLKLGGREGTVRRVYMDGRFLRKHRIQKSTKLTRFLLLAVVAVAHRSHTGRMDGSGLHKHGTRK